MDRTYSIGLGRVAVRTTSEAFGEWLDAVLGPYRVAETADFDYSVVVGGPASGTSRRREMHLLYAGSMPIARTFHLPTLGRMFLTEVESRLFPERNDAVYLDMGVALIGDVPALVPSMLLDFLGGLGGRVARSGVRLPAERFSAIDPDTGMVVPVRSRLEVPEGAVEQLSALDPYGGAQTDRIHLDRPVEVPIVCSYGFGERAMEPAAPALTLYRLSTDNAQNLDRLGARGLQGLGRLVERAACYEIRLGKAQSVLQALLAVRPLMPDSARR